jgi:hypothetical protein
LRTPVGDVVEVQFHSVVSATVKEATTRPYEIERSAEATESERAAAGALCVKLSDTLDVPPGLHKLRTLGGVAVEIKNYSDPRRRTDPAQAQSTSTTAERQIHRREDAVRGIDGTGR